MDRPQLPEAFRKRLKTQLAPAEADALCAALDDDSATTTSIRLNPMKSVDAAEGAQAVPWCDMGHLLPARPHFTADPLLHAGCYYVQEAASMSISLAYEAMAEAPALLLDLCAAPGGKSTLWRSLMPAGTLLVANEVVGSRAMVLRENLQKWGHPDIIVSEASPRHFARLTGLFDAIAADLPCSGEGMFRKDHGARTQWSERNAEMCARRGRDIITDVWPALRTGGYLIYSTCTFNPAENEENVDWICRELGAEIVTLSPPTAWGIVAERGMLHFYPHRTMGEGFFLALLRKTKDERTLRLKRVAKGKPLPRGWVAEPREFTGLTLADSTLCALRTILLPATTAIMEAVHTLAVGTEVCSAKGNKLIPAHALALSTILAGDAFPAVELTAGEARLYLSRQTLSLPQDTPRGYVTFTHKGHRLGFANNLGARANNLYPAHWRIRNL